MREITKKTKQTGVGIPAPIAKQKPASETQPDNRELNFSLLKATVVEDIEQGLEKARDALSGGADVNSKDDMFGVTALMLASSRGKFEIVELLVKSGADVNRRDNDGLSALYYATRAKNKEIMAFLQEHGARKVK